MRAPARCAARAMPLPLSALLGASQRIAAVSWPNVARTSGRVVGAAERCVARHPAACPLLHHNTPWCIAIHLLSLKFSLSHDTTHCILTFSSSRQPALLNHYIATQCNPIAIQPKHLQASFSAIQKLYCNTKSFFFLSQYNWAVAQKRFCIKKKKFRFLFINIYIFIYFQHLKKFTKITKNHFFFIFWTLK